MLIGHLDPTGNRLVATLSQWQVEPSHGVLRSRTLSHYQPQKQSMLLQHTLQNKYSGHRSLLKELDFKLPELSTIFSDNQGAISIAHHPEFHAKTKHIDISHHFLRDLVELGTIKIVYINTAYNLADIFTKGLPRPIHENFTEEIGVLSD